MSLDLRAWAEEHGHTDDYAPCHNCGHPRQDCTCCEEEVAPEDEDDEEEEDEE